MTWNIGATESFFRFCLARNKVRKISVNVFTYILFYIFSLERIFFKAKRKFSRYTRVGSKVHRLIKIFSWNVTKWVLGGSHTSSICVAVFESFWLKNSTADTKLSYEIFSTPSHNYKVAVIFSCLKSGFNVRTLVKTNS